MQDYLTLLVSATQYSTVSVVAFVPPTNPRVVPHITDTATAAQIRSITAKRKVDAYVWQQYTTIEKEFSQQTIAVYDLMYITTLCNRLTRFAGITTRQILEQLYLTYWDISAKYLADNHTKMNSPDDLNQPIDNLISPFDEATEVVNTAKTP